tara:strand:- start:415 stop:597 length:183 start_codon:yes stop_codon:yes gene_type:complete
MKIDLQSQYGCASVACHSAHLTTVKVFRLLSAKIGAGEFPPPPPGVPPVSPDPLPTPEPV